MIKIALFGTSADPPTAAHQQILQWLSHHYDQVAVWASDNPFKSHQTSLKHRAAMLQLLIEAIQPPRDNIQLHQDLSSPRALLTLERAQQRWGTAEFTLVIGSDLIGQLPRWYRVADLLEQVKLLVVPRPSYPVVNIDLQRLTDLGAHVAIASLMGLRLSSTDYRETRDAQGLIPPIEAYIHREHLYECPDAVPKSLVTPSPSGH